jgi:hypothetical protein
MSTYLTANPDKVALIRRDSLEGAPIAKGPQADYRQLYSAIVNEVQTTAKRGNIEKAKAMYICLSRLSNAIFYSARGEASFINGIQALRAVTNFDASSIADPALNAAVQALINCIAMRREPSWSDSALIFFGLRDESSATERRIRALAITSLSNSK